MSITANQPRGLNLPRPKPPIVPVTQENVRDWWALFVNRKAYMRQSANSHPDTGRHYHYQPNPTLTTGPQFFGKLLILRPRLQKVFTTVSPPYATVSARWETILGDGWDGNCRCNWWSSIW